MKVFTFIIVISLTFPAWAKITLDVDGVKADSLKITSILVDSSFTDVRVVSDNGRLYSFKNNALGFSRKELIDLLKEYNSSEKNILIMGQAKHEKYIDITKVNMDTGD